MATEIELKYQLSESNADSSNIVDDITAMLKSREVFFEMDNNHLVNDYFENDNLDLRKMDFGLRIRTKNKQYEQTIKTAGTVVGCLHQRPEYNVDIVSPKLDLSLFPKEIWPEGVNVINLQDSLKVIFYTNFSRHTWLINHDDNIIELAVDKGVIGTSLGKSTLAINEIEIELVKGNEQALFTLAKQLLTIISMDPAELSKAARGYALYNDEIKTHSA